MDIKAIILIGLACMFIPLVVAGLGSINADWSTVAVHVTWPIILIAFIGIVYTLMRNR